MPSLPFCVCGCGRRVPREHAIDGWRMECAATNLEALRMLQSLPLTDLGILVALLRDNGAGFLANTITGCVPFEQVENGQDT